VDWEKVYAKLEEEGFSINVNGMYITGYCLAQNPGCGQSFYRIMICPERRISVCVFSATYAVAQRVRAALDSSEFLDVPELAPREGKHDWQFGCPIKSLVVVRAD